MNKIESLPKEIRLNGTMYSPHVYITAFGSWCISYRNFANTSDYLCSVCVEPDNEPRKIEDTIGYLNEYIGNARTLDDAIDMIGEYVKRYKSYTVFQIPFPENEEDEKIYIKYAYKSLDRIDTVHPEYYKKTYKGTIETKNTNPIKVLDEIYTLLNVNHPKDYKGHSLSISDIVLIDGHYYYCADYGWEEVEFNV